MDARGAPQWVLLAHPLDEFAQLTANSGPSWPTTRFPAPIGPKSCAMPPQDRVRLNDVGQTEQAWPEPSGNAHTARFSSSSADGCRYRFCPMAHGRERRKPRAPRRRPNGLSGVSPQKLWAHAAQEPRPGLQPFTSRTIFPRLCGAPASIS